MGERYLKSEDAIIKEHYPTSTREEILALIPNRTWTQSVSHAHRMGVHRTSQAWGNSIREGRKGLRGSWTDPENDRFDLLYPTSSRSYLLSAFHPRTWHAIQSHAQKRHLHRTREAVGREINIGRENARKEKIYKNI